MVVNMVRKLDCAGPRLAQREHGQERWSGWPLCHGNFDHNSGETWLPMLFEVLRQSCSACRWLLNMHACVCAYMCVCMHACVCVCVYVCVYMHACVRACMHACVLAYVWVCVSVSVSVCVCVCVCGLFLTSKDYGGRVNEPFPTHLCRPVFVKEHSLTSCLWGCFPNGFPQYDWKV